MTKKKLQNKFIQSVVENLSAKHKVFYTVVKHCRSTQMTVSSVIVALWLDLKLYISDIIWFNYTTKYQCLAKEDVLLML